MSTAVFAAIGFSFAGTGQNNAMVFVKLKDFAERSDDRQHAAQRNRRRAMGAFSQHPRCAGLPADAAGNARHGHIERFLDVSRG